jgi:hypothetical protein
MNDEVLVQCPARVISMANDKDVNRWVAQASAWLLQCWNSMTRIQRIVNKFPDGAADWGKELEKIQEELDDVKAGFDDLANKTQGIEDQVGDLKDALESIKQKVDTIEYGQEDQDKRIAQNSEITMAIIKEIEELWFEVDHRVKDVVTQDGVSVVDKDTWIATLPPSGSGDAPVQDVQDATGQSLVDPATKIATIPAAPVPDVPVLDVRLGGQSVVDANKNAMLPAYPNVPVQDVQQGGESLLDGHGVANIPAFPTANVADVQNAQGVSLVDETTHIATVPDPSIPVLDVVDSAGTSIVNNQKVAQLPAPQTIPVKDVQDSTGASLVDPATQIATIPAQPVPDVPVLDVVAADGTSLVNAEKKAVIPNAPVQDVVDADGTSLVSGGLAQIPKYGDMDDVQWTAAMGTLKSSDLIGMNNILVSIGVQIDTGIQSWFADTGMLDSDGKTTMAMLISKNGISNTCLTVVAGGVLWFLTGGVLRVQNVDLSALLKKVPDIKDGTVSYAALPNDEVFANGVTGGPDLDMMTIAQPMYGLIRKYGNGAGDSGIYVRNGVAWYQPNVGQPWRKMGGKAMNFAAGVVNGGPLQEAPEKFVALIDSSGVNYAQTVFTLSITQHYEITLSDIRAGRVLVSKQYYTQKNTAPDTDYMTFHLYQHNTYPNKYALTFTYDFPATTAWSYSAYIRVDGTTETEVAPFMAGIWKNGWTEVALDVQIYGKEAWD